MGIEPIKFLITYHTYSHKQYLSKLTAHLYLTTDFDIISWLLTFTLTTVNYFSFLSILWSELFLPYLSMRAPYCNT